MEIRIDRTGARIAEERIAERRDLARQALKSLWSGTTAEAGWLNAPHVVCGDKPNQIMEMAEEIRSRCDVLLVLGAGGSFLGAKAAADLLVEEGNGVELLFAGHSFSGSETKRTLRALEDREVCLLVISKSGKTSETLAAYGIFKDYLLARYGETETAARTYVMTEDRSGELFRTAEREGCRLPAMMPAVGGRYSVLTEAGLLPLAAAGVDIRAMLRGARAWAGPERFAEEALDYAILRTYLHEMGKSVEAFCFFEPRFASLGEWLKQLFGESQGKDGKGLFPVSLLFSRDLHSMGQFLQQGTPCFLETMITTEEPLEDVVIPETAVTPLAGKTVEQINACAVQGVREAHIEAGIPLLSISIGRADAETLGALLYFFEVQCAVSAFLIGVDPFNQPGVEAYKRGMRAHIAALDQGKE